jgi:hypothetical protein
MTASNIMNDADIREVFLANGFTIKPGCDDLKPYVYAAARALLARRPVEKTAPVQGWPQGIPWSLHLEAYAAYCKRWGPQPALIDLEGRGCRGGFGTGELDEFIPGWRDRVSEIAQLRIQVKQADQRGDEALRRAHDAEAKLEALLSGAQEGVPAETAAQGAPGALLERIMDRHRAKGESRWTTAIVFDAIREAYEAGRATHPTPAQEAPEHGPSCLLGMLEDDEGAKHQCTCGEHTQERLDALNDALKRESVHNKVLRAIQSALQDFEPPDLAIAGEILHSALQATPAQAAPQATAGVAQPNGLMFDAFGEPRARYVRVSLNGAHCVMHPSEGDTYVGDARGAGDESPYVVADVYLSEREFENLGEFDGF